MRGHRVSVARGVVLALALALGLLAQHPASAERSDGAVGSVNATGGTAPDARAGGTNGWRLRQPAENREIEGYAHAVSGLPGQMLTLSVSTQDPEFRVTAFRFGDYRGGLATKVWASGLLPGVQQPAPVLDPYETRTVVAKWAPSVSVSTAGWPAGMYLLKLTSSSGFEAHIPYVVRSAETAGTVVLVAPVTTWQAYNSWGGYSLYVGPQGDQRSWMVSFDRPYRPTGGADFIWGVKSVVVLAERMDLPVSYLANTDLDTDRGVLQGARAYVSMGHDEYWTHGMRDEVESARDAGTNLAFLGANTMYWRIRLATNDAERPARQVIGYRWDSAQDPAWDFDPTLVTARWRDQPSADAENALVGMLYECHPVDTEYRIASPDWWGFERTGVVAGSTFPHLVGVEADRVYPIASTPRPLQILSYQRYPCQGVETSTQSTYYTTPSGAGVFTAGTLRWTCAIYRPCGTAGLTEATSTFVRQTTKNIFRVFGAGPAGVQHPAVDNVDSFWLPPDNQVPTS